MDLFLLYTGFWFFNKDEVIRVEHSVKLFSAVKNWNRLMVNPALMTHHLFDVDTDFIAPLLKFIKHVEFISDENKEHSAKDGSAMKFDIFNAKAKYKDHLHLNTTGGLGPKSSGPELHKLNLYKNRV